MLTSTFGPRIEGKAITLVVKAVSNDLTKTHKNPVDARAKLQCWLMFFVQMTEFPYSQQKRGRRDEGRKKADDQNVK